MALQRLTLQPTETSDINLAQSVPNLKFFWAVTAFQYSANNEKNTVIFQCVSISLVYVSMLNHNVTQKKPVSKTIFVVTFLFFTVE